MEFLILYLRLLLASVFVIAAVGKSLDFSGSRKASVSFGIPESLATISAVLLPVIELSIAVLLIADFNVFLGAMASSLLFVVFTSAMIYQRLRGNSPSCHCFGALSDEPVGIGTVARNILLLLISILVLAYWNRGESLLDVLDSTPLFAASLFVSAFLPVIVFLLASHLKAVKIHIDTLQEQLSNLDVSGRSADERVGHPEDSIPVGAPLPEAFLESLASGTQAPLSEIFGPGHHIAVFVGADCGPCAAMLPDLEKLRHEYSDIVSVRLIAEGDREKNRIKFHSIGIENIFLQKSKEVSSLFLSKWTPSAVLISNGVIASRVLAGELNIRKLFESLRGTESYQGINFNPIGTPRSRFKVGEELPSFSVFSISGEMIEAGSFIGSGGLILFMDPDCPHCSDVAKVIGSRLKSHNGSEPDSFRYLILTSGIPDYIAEYGLERVAVLDEGRMLSRILGAYGAPSGILVDASGRIVSETAVGSVAIEKLLGIHGGGDSR